MATKPISCWSCGNTWEFSPPLERADFCAKCRRDAKVCRNCLHFDPNASKECQESQVEMVKDKEKSNFCEWFSARCESPEHSLIDQGNPLDKLFGSEGEKSPKSKLEDELEAFFRKR